jgi:23S rRNA (adenine2503-C2)-methyltransferase
MKDIKDFTLHELKTELETMGEPAYRAGQIFNWLYHKGALRFEDMTNLPDSLRAKLAEHFVLGSLELEAVFRAKDRTEKFLFRLGDGNVIESVHIPAGGRATLCLSTQVGCKFSCAFCASGLNGFVRDLTPSEIVAQVLFLRDHLEILPTNLVFMGMGEPLDNFDNVAKAIHILNAPDGLAIAARRMTVSTAGVVPGIERFKELKIQVNLSVSLHAATDTKRNSLMPINKKYPLANLLSAASDYIKGGGRKITMEYVLIKDVNDAPSDAAALARIAARLRAKVNLIPYSLVAGLSFRIPEEKRIREFRATLEAKGVPVTVRESKGRDIQAACGQLAGRLQRIR